MKSAPALFYIITLFFAFGCSKYQKVMNGDDVKAKVRMADSLYAVEEYDRAKVLYNEGKNAYLPQEDSRRVLYHLAYCEFYTDEKYLAAYHFNRFYESYPYSSQAEDALYMNAVCQYDVSPKYSLDQSSTKKAINAYQLFVSRFPNSEKVEGCNSKIDELRLKLETKAFENAKLWHQILDYKSAVTALNNFIENYPASNFREEAEFLIVESSYLLATMSVPKKKLERFNEALDNYRDFKADYPQSNFGEKADKIEKQIVEELKLQKANG
ncbi:MAG: outer membrane protein assembly factor BamD [Bacteroidetes bacterium]|nr:outer membrane protein assembly factor BamD [Bacteroidota bacterium]